MIKRFVLILAAAVAMCSVGFAQQTGDIDSYGNVYNATTQMWCTHGQGGDVICSPSGEAAWEAAMAGPIIVVWPPGTGWDGPTDAFYSAADYYAYVLNQFGNQPFYRQFAFIKGWPQSWEDYYSGCWSTGCGGGF